MFKFFLFCFLNKATLNKNIVYESSFQTNNKKKKTEGHQ